MFILLMFFLFKYIDDLIGKGFEWYTILELMWYSSVSQISMALPLSILLSSIMTFGNLGENSELVAIKSAGISLQRAMRPLFVLIFGLAVGCFFFSDYMLPKANLKLGSMLYDMRNKKLSFLIKPGVFNNSIPGYAIRVERKSEGRADSLYGIIVYDHTGSNGIAKIIIAEKGQMVKTKDDKYLVLTLENGVCYEESAGKSNYYNNRQTFTRMRYRKTEVKLDLASFATIKTPEQNFKNYAPMMSRSQLIKHSDSLLKSLDTLNKALQTGADTYFKQENIVRGYSKITAPQKIIKGNIINAIPKTDRMAAARAATDQAQGIKMFLDNRFVDYDFKKGEILSSQIEYQRKYTLAVSCVLLFLIGAPLGAIIRKGGFGLPVVMAVIFFLIYHIISTVAEKSAKEGSMTPGFGMWLAIIVLTPLGIFLTYKATADSALFDVEYYKQLFLKIFKRKKN